MRRAGIGVASTLAASCGRSYGKQSLWVAFDCGQSSCLVSWVLFAGGWEICQPVSGMVIFQFVFDFLNGADGYFLPLFFLFVMPLN